MYSYWAQYLSFSDIRFHLSTNQIWFIKTLKIKRKLKTLTGFWALSAHNSWISIFRVQSANHYTTEFFNQYFQRDLESHIYRQSWVMSYGNQGICHCQALMCSTFNFIRMTSWMFQNIKMNKAKKELDYLLSVNTPHLAMFWNASMPRLCCLSLFRMTLLTS